MTRRRTVEDWRAAVFRAARISGNTRMLLLYLADHMHADRSVSVPREQLEAALAISGRCVAERIADAHKAGFLSTKAGGYRGHTAVYEGLFPEPPQ